MTKWNLEPRSLSTRVSKKTSPKRKSHINSWNMSFLCKKYFSKKNPGKIEQQQEKKSKLFLNRKKSEIFFDNSGKLEIFFAYFWHIFWSLWQDRYQCKIQNLLRKILKKSQIKKTPRNLNLRISKKLDSNFFSYFFPPLEFFLLATPILKKHLQKMATSTISWKAGKSEKWRHASDVTNFSAFSAFFSLLNIANSPTSNLCDTA